MLACASAMAVGDRLAANSIDMLQQIDEHPLVGLGVVETVFADRPVTIVRATLSVGASILGVEDVALAQRSLEQREHHKVDIDIIRLGDPPRCRRLGHSSFVYPLSDSE